ncbi:hypothetical protein [Escherichia coli]|uniref:hypothetical protein n=1 Tax=Escherichia coli TaxID=562 RepID=UPI002FCD1F48
MSSFIDGVVDLVTEPPEALAVYTTLRNQWAGDTCPTGCHRRTAGRYHREARQRGRR